MVGFGPGFGTEQSKSKDECEMSDLTQRSAVGKNRATCCSFPERRAVTAGRNGLVFKASI